MLKETVFNIYLNSDNITELSKRKLKTLKYLRYEQQALYWKLLTLDTARPCHTKFTGKIERDHFILENIYN